MDSLLRPSGFVLLSAHFVRSYMGLCVRVSGGKSMVLVLLSVSSVSLVSYHQPPPAPATQHVLSVSPRGQSTNPTALCLEDTASSVQNGPSAISESVAAMSKFEAWSQTSAPNLWLVRNCHISSSKSCSVDLDSDFYPRPSQRDKIGARRRKHLLLS